MNGPDNNKKSIDNNQIKEEQMKTRCKTIMLAVLLIGAIAVMVPQAAMATGTAANTAITNTATLNYNVGGVGQTAVTGSVTFNVDIKIRFSITAGNQIATPLGVTPNTLGNNTTNAIKYTIANIGNAPQNFKLTMVDTNGFTGGGAVTYYWNTTGTLNTLTDTAIVSGGTIPAVARDTNVYLFSVADVPATATDTQTRTIAVTAVSVDGGGAALVAGGVAGSGTAIVIANAGQLNTTSDTGEYLVQTASITVNKTFSVTAGPTEAPAVLLAVPGATVHYSIQITNNGSADATTISIGDPIPANMTYVAASLNAPGSATAAYAPTTVTVTYATLAKSGGTYTFTFDCTIN
jgi:uncharacterized repeat protein (TIGR01451 family)